MRYLIEYEIPPLRAIYTVELDAINEVKAKELFIVKHPRAKIRGVKNTSNK
jgi:hypothetical protein